MVPAIKRDSRLIGIDNIQCPRIDEQHGRRTVFKKITAARLPIPVGITLL
jgi:hypothetical protein